MITAIVQFPLPDSARAEDAEAFFANISEMFYNIPGLVRKYFVLSDDAKTGGGVYLWETREAADRFYTENFRLSIQEKFGAEPSITYFHCPVIVESGIGKTIIAA